MPGTLLVEPLTWWPGVCGGVKRGMPPGFEFEPVKLSVFTIIDSVEYINTPAAAMDGIALIEGVGLFIAGGAF
jgi:hypothetical protein